MPIRTSRDKLACLQAQNVPGRAAKSEIFELRSNEGPGSKLRNDVGVSSDISSVPTLVVNS